MGKSRQSFGRSFVVAFKGIRFALLHERNLRLHFIATILVYVLAWYIKVNRVDVLWLSSAIALVWVTELLNTAIEQLTNLVHPEHHPVAGRVKDLAAGAVLLASLYGIVVAIVVFYPYFFS